MKRLIFILSIPFIFSSCIKENNISNDTDIRGRLADRRYIKKILQNVYGPKSNEIIDRNIWFKPETFGFPCDPNEEIWIKGKKKKEVFNKEVKCPRGLMDAKVPISTSSSSLRTASLNKVCSILTNKLEVLSPIFRSAIFSNENIQKVYGAFYVFEKMDDLKVQKIQKVLEGESLINKWKYLFLTTCMSQGWQIL
jgi:hypothetical protein